MRMENWCKILLGTSFVVIAVLAVIPDGSSANRVALFSIGLDKLFHFFGFAALLLLAFRSGIAVRTPQKMLLLLLLFLYGAGIEGVQHFLPYRTFNLLDLAANGSGLLFGVLLWSILHRTTSPCRTTGPAL